jgi:hypothetical protein
MELNAPMQPGRISLADSHSGRLAPMYQTVGSLVHLPGCGPVNLDVSSLRFFRKPAEQVAEAPAEQRLEIPFLRAVCEEF